MSTASQPPNPKLVKQVAGYLKMQARPNGPESPPRLLDRVTAAWRANHDAGRSDAGWSMTRGEIG